MNPHQRTEDSLKRRVGYSSVSAKVDKDALVVHSSDAELVRIFRGSDGLVVDSKELGQITPEKVQVLVALGCLSIDLAKGERYNRLWFEKISGFNALLDWANDLNRNGGRQLIRIIPADRGAGLTNQSTGAGNV